MFSDRGMVGVIVVDVVETLVDFLDLGIEELDLGRFYIFFDLIP
jgi:hypothetical protein